jgi:monoamine oxidase
MSTGINRRDFLKVGVAAGLSSGIAQANSIKGDPDVIVIGAGLSGLNATYLLEELGARAICLEGRERPGGRLFSHPTVTGNPEWGGDSILGSYGRMQDMARRLDIKLIDHHARRDLSPESHRDPRRVELALGGGIIPLDEWPEHPLNTMPTGARERFPGRGFFQGLIAENNPLASFADWADPKSAKYDRSAYEFFKELGWSDAAIELNYNTNVQYGTSAHDVSMLMWFFVQAWFKSQTDAARVAYKVDGGNQRFPEAMAGALKSEVHYGKQVVGIRTGKSDVAVHCYDGSVYRASRVICSMPIPTMRWVKFDPLLPAAKAKAIRTVQVQKITKIIMVPKRPFWEDDGLSPAMWTDTDAGEIRAQREGEDSNDVTCLMAWGRGHLADCLDTLGPKAAMERVLAAYEKLRPAAKGNLELAGIKSWQTDPFAGGDWAIWGPGQVTESLPALMEPANRIHFCGEHTATTNRGMEGAMESGVRVAFEVSKLM